MLSLQMKRIMINKLFSEEKHLLNVTIVITLIWIVMQAIIIAFFWGTPQFSDPGRYIYDAIQCYNSNKWYPMSESIYSHFIWAPGFINYLILQLNLFGTINFNAIFNLFINIAILLEVFYIANKFFSKRTALISVILFCSIFSNSFVVLGANSDLPFLFFCLSALCLIFSGKWKNIFFAAIFLAIANWIRPLAIIFIFAAILYFIFSKAKYYNYLTLIILYISTLFAIGSITEHYTGYFIYQSSTSGFNLIMTYNDEATGAIGSTEEVHFIENIDSLTFVERDSIWKEKAVNWIKENPLNSIVLYLKKIPAMYIHDGWATWSFWELPVAGEVFSDSSKVAKFRTGFIVKTIVSIPYYFTFLLFFYSLFINRKKIININLVLLFVPLIGTLISAIFPAGTRYHYPFMFVIIIFGAWGVNTWIETKKMNHK